MMLSRRVLLWCALAAPISLVGLTGLVDRSSGGAVTEAAGPAVEIGDPAAQAASFSDQRVFARVVAEDCPYPDVCPTNAAPVITTNGGNPISETSPENATYFNVNLDATDDTDSEGSGLTYSISGPDAVALGVQSATGIVVFNNPPDFEVPGDADGDNVYEAVVTVTDSGGETDTIGITVEVTDVAGA